LILGAWAPGARAQTGESLVRQGNAYYKQGNPQKAVDAYRQATIRNPENSVFKYNLGTGLAKAGNMDEAQKVLTEAAEMQGAPRRRDAYYNKGVILGEAGIKGPEDGAAAGAPPGGGAAPGQEQAVMAQLGQQIEMLTQSLGAFRKDILTDPKDVNAVYNYETVQAMLARLRNQMEQMKKENQNQQQQGDKNQQQKKNEGKQNQQNGKGGQNGNQRQQGQQQNQDQSQGEGEQLKAEQIDANALLNLLEAEKPDQFKNLFKFRGGEKERRPQKDW
jgi:tetratricopeptide (TPR) repeat protein